MTTSPRPMAGRSAPVRPLGATLRLLVGSGDQIGLAVLPVLAVGLALNLAFPGFFAVGGPPAWLRALSVAVLVPGLVGWAWSALLILTRVPRGVLITGGPFRLVRHPLYTAVALLVLPWAGFLLDSWLGVVLGLALYAAARRYAPVEETELARRFGPAWDRYRGHVALPWL